MHYHFFFPRMCPGLVLFFVLLLAGTAHSAADTFRVTSWDWGGIEQSGATAGQPSSNKFHSGVIGLKALNPDLIFLRNVRSWQACDDLARALGTNLYTVVVCSAFPAQEPGAPARQLAILCRRKAYFAWSERWAGGSGIVFAAIQTGARRVGFFLAEAGPGVEAESLHRHWAGAATAFRGWQANRLDSVVVGLSLSDSRPGAFDETWRTQQLADAARSAFPEHVLVKAGPGSLVTARLNANPSMAPALIATQWPATFDLTVETDAPTVLLSIDGGRQVAASSARMPDPLAPDPTRLPAADAWASPYVATALKLITDERAKPAATIGGAFAAVLACWWIWRMVRRRKRRMLPGRTGALLPDSDGAAGLLGNGPGGVVLAESGDQDAAQWRERALAAEAKARQALDLVKSNAGPALGELLQNAAVQKLIADRTTLLETQSNAIVDARHLDERMARIEERLRQQSQSYEQRIRELEQDLAAAEEQNRAMIQSKIYQLKSEMASARRMTLTNQDSRAESEEQV